MLALLLAVVFASAPHPALRATLSPLRGARELVVAQDGTGDFKSIQEAVDAIPADNSETRIVVIRNRTYHEKVMIRTSHVALVGEDREKTRIEYAELRRNW